MKKIIIVVVVLLVILGAFWAWSNYSMHRSSTVGGLTGPMPAQQRAQ